MNAALLHSRPAMLNMVACIALLYLLNAIHAGVFPLSISFSRSVSPFRLRTLPLIQQFKVANHTLCSMFYAFFIRIQLAQHSKGSKRSKWSMCAMHGYYVQKPVSTFYSTALILVHLLSSCSSQRALPTVYVYVRVESRKCGTSSTLKQCGET